MEKKKGGKIIKTLEISLAIFFFSLFLSEFYFSRVTCYNLTKFFLQIFKKKEEEVGDEKKERKNKT